MLELDALMRQYYVATVLTMGDRGVFKGCSVIQGAIYGGIDAAASEFRAHRVVQTVDFIDEPARMDILATIDDNTSLMKYNANSAISALGQLQSAKHNDDERIFKQHYIIDGTAVFENMPDVRYAYHNCFADYVSRVVQTRVYPVEERGTINNTIIVYENENDSLRWHTDGSMYNGKKVFTLLVYLFNRSSQELCYVEFDSGRKLCVPTPQGSCVVLEHFTLQHYVTPLRRGEKRVVWSMTFAEDPSFSSVLSYAKDKIKNANYMGTGALRPLDYGALAAILAVICVVTALLFRRGRCGSNRIARIKTGR